jgi:hypothetical protein
MGYNQIFLYVLLPSFLIWGISLRFPWFYNLLFSYLLTKFLFILFIISIFPISIKLKFDSYSLIGFCFKSELRM